METTIYESKIDADTDLIVLSHNNYAVSKEFINNLYENTDMSKIHVIWIDNGSADNSQYKLKEEFKNETDNVTLIFSDKNLGVIDGRNFGYSVSNNRKNKSKYLLYLDNDQFVKKGWLEHHFAVLSHGYDMVGVEAWRLGASFLPVEHVQKIGQPFTYVGCGGMLIKREVTDKIGMFDTNFNPSYYEDPDFCCTAIENGFKIGWNAKAKLVHLPHQTLGKLDAREKQRRFLKSLSYFRKKWGKKKLPVLRQVDLPEFLEEANHV